MALPYRKKLIEVALPLKAINDASVREKEPFTRNHPRSLHIWWARRPLVACRAVLFASLVDDPDSDPKYSRPDGSVDEDAAGIKRADLFNLIEELVQWENSADEDIIRSARAEIARCVASRKLELGEISAEQELGPGTTVKTFIRDCHCRPVFVGLQTELKRSDRQRFAFRTSHLPAESIVNDFLAKYAPPVLDPFCGGGSIPIEAQRLGLRAFASDLNPVPVLINKALVEIPPRFAECPPVNPEYRKRRTLAELPTKGAEGLAADVRYYGEWLRCEAERQLKGLYPSVEVTKTIVRERPDLEKYAGQELKTVAWIWARTVASPNPAIGGVHVPLVKSYWLCTKKGKEAYVEPVINKEANTYQFRVHVGVPSNRSAVSAGTKVGRGCKFECLLSGEPIPEEHVKAEGMAGRLGVKLMAVVAEGVRERLYLSATPDQEAAANLSPPANLGGIQSDIALDKRAIWCLLYGLDTFDKLFTPRQLTALLTFTELLHNVRVMVKTDANSVMENGGASLNAGGDGADAYADAVITYLALSISRWTDLSNAICSWNTTNQNIRALFARQGIPMSWDFVELSPFSSVAPITSTIASAANSLESLRADVVGVVSQVDAAACVECEGAPLVSTDPPYYDNIGYADLSDFFYVWLRRCLSSVFPSLFSTVLTPKSQELIASPYRHGGSRDEAQAFFESGLATVFNRICGVHALDYPVTVYYAFKQSESEDSGVDPGNVESTTASTGWETMLNGLIQSGFRVIGTWPVRTERETRSVGLGTNALASCIVLVCRPRSADAPLTSRREFLSSLKRELPVALNHLQQGNIAPVDLAQAAIGPGMAVYSTYSKVMEADGSRMNVRQALSLINQTLDEVLAEQEGEFDSDTRWAISWFQEYGMEEGPFGAAEILSKAKNTAVNGLVAAGIVATRAGKVRLLGRGELNDAWDPNTDERLTAWEVTQHLIRVLEADGELAAAELMNRLGGMAETARELAYRLYNICERKNWTDDALAFNGLVLVWPELTKLSLVTRSRPQETQQDLFKTSE